MKTILSVILTLTLHLEYQIFPIQNTCTVKPVSKGHSRESENVLFMDSCPLDIG